MILSCAVPQALYISFNIQCFGLSHLIRMENWCSRPGRWAFLCDTGTHVSAFGAEGTSLAKTSNRFFSPWKAAMNFPSEISYLSGTSTETSQLQNNNYLWILLSSTGTSGSSDFHMKSSVSFTFSENWTARTLVLSRHSASFSELRRSMLIKSTASDRNNSDPFIESRNSVRIHRRCVSVSQGSLTVEVRGIAVAWTWMP